jgi:hypothetical protein
LANLFLHYAFDRWMRRSHPAVPFERYADDVICHCRSQDEANRLLEALQTRFESCGLQLHPEKTHVVYCRDSNRKAPFADVQFTFLGFAFRPRIVRNRRGTIFTGFSPAVSPPALKRMRERIRAIGLPSLVYLSIEDIARLLNPVLRGWIQYYGRFYRTELIRKLYRYLDDRIAAWLRQKYKKLRGHRLRSWRLLARIRSCHRDLFAHWHRASAVVSG